ncbi:MAG: hypothetical protein U9N85_08865 [Bacteroidota bacterium]|nr:hypothetical protein [Bacteroidota bacterium]
MKISWLILIVLFFGLTAFNLNVTFDGNNPSVKVDIYTISNPLAEEDVIRFSIRLCSADNLENFSIVPFVQDKNNSALHYSFNHNVKQASINYFYTVSKNTTQKKIKFSFILEDNNNSTKRVHTVSL